MKLKFTPEMFDDPCLMDYAPTPFGAALKAQQIYDNYIKGHGKVVYQIPRQKFWYLKEHLNLNDYEGVAHRAVIIEITEIEEKPCVHVPGVVEAVYIDVSKHTFQCKLCGVEIKASVWEEMK